MNNEIKPFNYRQLVIDSLTAMRDRHSNEVFQLRLHTARLDLQIAELQAESDRLKTEADDLVEGMRQLNTDALKWLEENS